MAIHLARGSCKKSLLVTSPELKDLEFVVRKIEDMPVQGTTNTPIGHKY
jgi:hypothetical protein